MDRKIRVPANSPVKAKEHEPMNLMTRLVEAENHLDESLSNIQSLGGRLGVPSIGRPVDANDVPISESVYSKVLSVEEKARELDALIAHVNNML